MATPSIPRDWIERYADEIGIADYEVIASMLVRYDAEMALSRQQFEKTIDEKKARIATNVAMDHKYFTQASDVWRAYNYGRISMAERDRALATIRSGLPAPVVYKAKAHPKTPISIDDLL